MKCQKSCKRSPLAPRLRRGWRGINQHFPRASPPGISPEQAGAPARPGAREGSAAVNQQTAIAACSGAPGSAPTPLYLLLALGADHGVWHSAGRDSLPEGAALPPQGIAGGRTARLGGEVAEERAVARGGTRHSGSPASVLHRHLSPRRARGAARIVDGPERMQNPLHLPASFPCCLCQATLAKALDLVPVPRVRICTTFTSGKKAHVCLRSSFAILLPS